MPPALCEPILAVPRPKGERVENSALMRRINALFLKYPFQSVPTATRTVTTLDGALVSPHHSIDNSLERPLATTLQMFE